MMRMVIIIIKKGGIHQIYDDNNESHIKEEGICQIYDEKIWQERWLSYKEEGIHQIYNKNIW